MTRTVNKLIEQAYKKAGLYTQDKIVQGYKVTEALDALNDVLDENSADSSYVAFYDVVTFPLVPGQSTYVVGTEVGDDVIHNRIVELKHMVLLTTGTRYPVEITSDYAYYSALYYESATGRPTTVFMTNSIGKTTLKFIVKPDIAYDCEMKVKSILSNLTLNTDITNVPPYYFQYLKYALAKELALEYMPENWTAHHEARFQRLEHHLRTMADIDTDLRVSSALIGRRQGYYNNLGVVS